MITKQEFKEHAIQTLDQLLRAKDYDPRTYRTVSESLRSGVSDIPTVKEIFDYLNGLRIWNIGKLRYIFYSSHNLQQGYDILGKLNFDAASCNHADLELHLSIFPQSRKV